MADTITMGAFRAEILALVQHHFSDLRLEPGGNDAELMAGSVRVYLRNLFVATRCQPDLERHAAILKFFQVIARDLPYSEDEQQALDDWATAMPLLRPKFLSATDTPNIQLFVRQPFSPKLILTYGLDLGNRDVYVFEDRLAKWDVPLATVHEAAIANLEDLSTDIDFAPTLTGDACGLVVVNEGDFYDAPRILLPELRSRLVTALGPRLLAGIPDRTAFIVWSAGLEGQEGLIGQIQSDWATQPYPQTDEIFVLTKDGPRLAGPGDLGRQ